MTTTDPDIQKAWDDLRTGLRRTLRPYVADVSLDDLVTRIVADLIHGCGWKPPLRHIPDVITQNRTASARRALADDPEGRPV
jgi:hypothetical protein